MSRVNCTICGNSNISAIYKDYPGYVKGYYFDIYTCSVCNTNFISSENIHLNIYETIYSYENLIGYDRYKFYADKVKKVNNPLKLLADFESTYYSVFKCLKKETPNSVLEVGCGLGYLTYALNKQGINTIGIDISSNAINFAKSNYGSGYFNLDITNFRNIINKKFDLIVATELIEHLREPVAFINECLGLLNENGKILLTTPNKDFSTQNAIWQTDLPPVHTVWLSSKSFQFIADKLGLDVAYVTFKDYYPISENRLIKYLRSRTEYVQSSILTTDGGINNERLNIKFSKPHIVLRNIFHNLPPVRSVCNFIYNQFYGVDKCLAVILSRN